MTSDADHPAVAPAEGNIEHRAAFRMGLLGLAIIAVGAVAILAALVWGNDERDRALRDWQVRLGIVAESRAAAIGDWLARQRRAVTFLADNDSVRLYVGEISGASGGGDPAERRYLENFLLAVAAREGFLAQAPQPSVRANVPRAGLAGMAIVGPDLTPLAVTPDFPGLNDAVRQLVAARFVTDTRPVGSMAFGPYRPANGNAPAMAFIAPVTGIQDDGVQAVIIGIKPVADELYPLLVQPGAASGTAEALLLRAEGNIVRYLSPADDPAPVPEKVSSLDTPGLAAALAAQNPTGFVRGRDYRDAEVLMASRPVPASDWVLAYKIDHDEALGPTERRLLRSLSLLVGAIILAMVAMFAVWRHGTSRRLAAQSETYRLLAARHKQQADFIRLLADSLPNAVFITGADGQLRFANATLGRRLGMADAHDLVGKSLQSVFGPHDGRRLARLAEDVVADGTASIDVDRKETANGPKITRSLCVPLRGTAPDAGVLVVQEDLTDVIVAEERAGNILSDVIDLLVSLVDLRDPNATNHSAMVTAVAASVAAEMGLDGAQRDAVAAAGRLFNVGKIFVPVEILTKEDRLTEAEYRSVDDALLRGIELVSHIDFDGPVGPILAEARSPGTDLALMDNEVRDGGQIVAMANSFVAMTSKRAHRAPITPDAAIRQLLDSSGTPEQRRVAAAMANAFENRGGRDNWMRPL